MNHSIVAPGYDLRRRIRIMRARIEAEYDSQLKTSNPEEVAALKNEMKKRIAEEGKTLRKSFRQPGLGPQNILW